jgi:hypothetical protein
MVTSRIWFTAAQKVSAAPGTGHLLGRSGHEEADRTAGQ